MAGSCQEGDLQAMNETLPCSACSRPLHVPDELRGQSVKCPACHHVFTAPEAGFDTIPREQHYVPPVEEPPPPRRPVLQGESGPYDARPPQAAPYREDYRVADQPAGRYDKPGKVQAIAIMTLIGGIGAIMVSLAWAFSCVGLIIAPYSFVLGVLAIIKASNLLGNDAYRQTPPKAIAIMQIINILCLDVLNLVLGIITLVFLGDRDVKDYFRC
jgi:hypothetical protein